MVNVRPHRRAVPLAVTHEAWLVVAGLVLAYLIVRSDAIGSLAVLAADFGAVLSFVVGIFFTSVLTTTPAIVAIAELGNHIEPWKLALIGGAGSVCGDMLLFRFVRSPLADYIVSASTNPTLRRIGRYIDGGPLWWTVPALGALIIASPLPDELGLLMMGLSHIKWPVFLVLAYAMNAAGIFLIASAGGILLS